ncbi:hypothetical protein AB0C42_16465 [Micromonospora taraxaci]|uniref:hypothetical protein n=1 Tax=Micromonospora taraxaci TaxID=1316803 RepID=UPI001ABFA22D|nr:hypothetical protein [Micromonospora taraxaci]
MDKEVADRAGVAVQTVYFVFGIKRTRSRTSSTRPSPGTPEPVATMDREWFGAACAAQLGMMICLIASA